jgi:hypothetical protein
LKALYASCTPFWFASSAIDEIPAGLSGDYEQAPSFERTKEITRPRQ